MTFRCNDTLSSRAFLSTAYSFCAQLLEQLTVGANNNTALIQPVQCTSVQANLPQPLNPSFLQYNCTSRPGQERGHSPHQLTGHQHILAGGLATQRLWSYTATSCRRDPSLYAVHKHTTRSASTSSSSVEVQPDAAKGFVRGGFTVDAFPPERIRNLCIIAHVDHGKSTLADRLMEACGAIAKGSQAQYLDKLQVGPL